jgi:hypothetical protein
MGGASAGADDSLIFIVRTDPEPENPLFRDHTHGTDFQRDSNRVNRLTWVDALELKARMAWVVPKLTICTPGVLANLRSK